MKGEKPASGWEILRIESFSNIGNIERMNAMVIGIPKETEAGERRTAASPDSIRKLISNGFSIRVEAGAGSESFYSDDDFREAGAEIAPDAEDLYAKSQWILKVRPPTEAEADMIRENTAIVSLMNPFGSRSLVEKLAARNVTVFALEMVPRISRAQSMDVLSSQANLAGYKSVLMAAEHYPGLFPMLMTAAGTVRAARVLVLGVGVAGLQAIATAKRLGAVVSAFDIRSAVKDQVKSLGADFVEIDLGIEEGEGSGGYARELTEDERKRQIELLGRVIARQDIVITTAAVPGRPAPKLISTETVRSMKPGSVIVDLAAESGGNCESTQPGRIVRENGVTLVGTTNIPSLLSVEATNLFARNAATFLLALKTEEGGLAVNREDEIVRGSLLTHEGKLVHAIYE